MVFTSPVLFGTLGTAAATIEELRRPVFADGYRESMWSEREHRRSGLVEAKETGG